MHSEWRKHASTVTRISNIDPTTPTGLCEAFRLGASQCLRGARQIRLPDTSPQYILAFHAIELALKAYLVRSGLTIKDVKKHRHDLVKLYAEAVHRGLSIKIEHADDLISWINEYHSGNARIRYEFAEYRELPICDHYLFPLADAVIAASA